MNRKSLRVLLTAFITVASLFVALTPAQAVPNGCESKIRKYFFEDYFGKSWSDGTGLRVITWTAQPSVILNRPIARQLTKKEHKWLRIAVRSWDAVLETIEFVEVADSQADLVVGFVNQKLGGNVARWIAWYDESGTYNSAAIRFRISSDFLRSREGFIHTAQHEIGNVLGLGDIKPKKGIKSVLNDPFTRPYGPKRLGAFDTRVIKQLYGELPCIS